MTQRRTSGDQTLPPGTRLQNFEIIRLLGQGGFGVVYLASEDVLGRKVAIKEYMPPTAVRVDGTSEVIARSGSDLEIFELGLKSFVNEARLLARFDHPALVKVLRFWEENGTAYMAMPFFDGFTLTRALSEKQAANDEKALRALLDPVMDALALLHQENVYHRDVAPDNIMLTAKGPVLLDLGAARQAVSGATQNFTAILKEGYAPVEQYGPAVSSVDSQQGPWTDIYALCGVFRYAITGQRPVGAVVRMLTTPDPQQPLSESVAGQYSEAFLRAIDAGSMIWPQDRPQSIAAFRQLMNAPGAPALSVARRARPEVRVEATAQRPTVQRPSAGPSLENRGARRRKLPWVAGAALAGMLGVLSLALVWSPALAPAAWEVNDTKNASPTADVPPSRGNVSTQLPESASTRSPKPMVPAPARRPPRNEKSSSPATLSEAEVPDEAGLRKFIGKDPVDLVRGQSLLQTAELRSRLNRLVGPRGIEAIEKMTDTVPIRENSGWLLASGCRAGACDAEGWAVAVQLTNLDVLVCIGSGSEVTFAGTGKRTIRRLSGNGLRCPQAPEALRVFQRTFSGH